MEKIEGAKLIGRTWHYNKRVPKRLVEAYGLPEFKRGTMKTQDPNEAKRLARAMLNELDELEAKLDSVSERVKVFGDLTPKEQNRLEEDIARNVAALPSDQRNLISKSGGARTAIKDMEAHEVSAAFMTGAEGADFAFKEAIGEPYDPDEREIEEAQDVAFRELQERKGKALRSALTAAEVVEPAGNVGTGLRDLLDAFCNAMGYVDGPDIKSKARGQYEYAVRRFIEFHGDLPLTDLRKRHLSEFATEFLKLPVSSRRDVRPLPFREAVKVAERENLPRVAIRTRDQNLSLLQSLMSYAVGEEILEGDDPWAGYKPTNAKQKISTSRQKKRHVFSRDEIKRIVAHTRDKYDPTTIDFWGPLFGALHGLRVEEVAQLRIADIVTAEGILCVSVTDEGDLQKLKNANTFRTIPIHGKIIELGFADFVTRRREAGGDMLFMEADRSGKTVHEISHDSQGRFGTRYSKRFKRVLTALKIEGYKVGYHSFRHAWTDLARSAGINPEHRRALAGRESDAGRDAPRVDRIENRYGHGFLIADLSQSLNQLQPL